MTYSEIKTLLSQCAADIAAERNRITSGKNQLTLAANNLAGFAAKYGALVTAVTSLATAEPTSAAAMLASDEKNRLVAEFNSLKTTADALVAAVSD